MRLLLLLCFILVNITAICQVNRDTIPFQSGPGAFEFQHEQSAEVAFYYAGMHLEKYTRQSYNGMLMVAGGSFCAIITQDMDPGNSRRALSYAAFGLSAWGMIKTIIAIKHVGKAGKILKTIRLNENGVAVAIPIR